MTDDSGKQPDPATSSSSPPRQKIPHWMFVLIIIAVVGLMAWRHFVQPAADHADQPNPTVAANSPTPAEVPSTPEDSSATTGESLPATQHDANSTTSDTDASSSSAKSDPPATPPSTKSVNSSVPAKSKPVTEPTSPAKPKPDSTTKSEKPATAKPRPDTSGPDISGPDKSTARPDPKRMIVQNVTIKDLDGKIVYRGDVDLTDTLDRIAKNKRLRYSNDGSVFQNRERRLPTKPAGYYHEYVHETVRLDGPGPQRIVTGQKGEIYYTHDHYRTFKKLR